ncbi:MAG: hypothetical protein IJV22_02610 [Bacteroidales bacterium]|nr:hypothetical protein [Bacteroidales bacterium]
MTSKKRVDKSIRELISSTWGIVISAFTIFGMGFGAGCYFENSLSKIHYNDELTRLNNLIIDNREKHEQETHELRNQIYNLQEALINEKEKRNESK